MRTWEEYDEYNRQEVLKDSFKACLISALVVVFVLLITCIASAEVDTTKAVIHHTASPDWNVEKIRRIHVDENGWKDIGYHYIIRANGDIETGRPLSQSGAHAKGRNGYVGIALTGYDKFTKEQIESLLKLLKENRIIHIERHHEECPGEGLNVEQIQKEIK